MGWRRKRRPIFPLVLVVHRRWARWTLLRASHNSKWPELKAFPVHDTAHNAFMTLSHYTNAREIIIASDEMQQKERS